MNLAHVNKVEDARGITLGIVSPDGRQGMVEHAAQFVARGIPFVFDPGQGLPMFDGEDLKTFIDQASWVSVNDYELQLLQERTGLSPHDIAGRVQALIVTRGGEGSHIYTATHRIEIPAAPARGLNDPTGCGDAYRGGLLFGLLQGLDWETTGRIAALMGAIKIEHHGTQNHRFTRDEFRTRYRDSFGAELPGGIFQ
jgi:adenosine kinase